MRFSFGRAVLGRVVIGASCPVSSTRSELRDDRDMRKHVFVVVVFAY